MRGRFALYVVAVGLLGLAGVNGMLLLYAAILNEPVWGFGVTSLLAVLVGLPLLRFGLAKSEPTRREAMVGVLLLWLIVPLVGALPFAVTGGLTALDAIFESMSGFTTTGATVLVDFDGFPASLFLWRAFTQWIGGIGIIVLFIAVFPHLAIAGRQLFYAEVPGPIEDRLSPRLRNTAAAVLLVYLILTALSGVAYYVAGMTAYESVAHAFTTIASGGFSPNGLSFEAYAPAVNWVAIVFMVFAGANFALQHQALMGRPSLLLRDPEFRAYLAIVLVAAVLLIISLWGTYEFADALRHGLFQSLSVVTTTGYASADFAEWPVQGQAILVTLMLVGGSAGSAAGGIKVVRWLIVAKLTKAELKKALHPRAVIAVRVGSRLITDTVIRAVGAFITVYVTLFVLTTLVVAWLEQDFASAFTASIACIGNIGPGLAAVGPMLNYSELHPLSKVLLTFGMYAGRLEIVTVFVIFDRDFWYLPRHGRVGPH